MFWLVPNPASPIQAKLRPDLYGFEPAIARHPRHTLWQPRIGIADWIRHCIGRMRATPWIPLFIG